MIGIELFDKFVFVYRAQSAPRAEQSYFNLEFGRVPIMVVHNRDQDDLSPGTIALGTSQARCSGEIIGWESSEMDEHQRRPVGIALLSFFFLFGVLASGLSVVMLLLPGTPLDVLWRLNPHGHEGFLAMGPWAVVLMSAVCFACATAALGLWRCRRWGRWMAIVILTINLVGDTINSLRTHDWRTLIGVPIAGLMISYLFKR